ncbi:MAG: hypothetical protein O2944_11460 [Proteobacteria bacterium]|nr:hypothetical protein [Pseudomonadota bacterium]
MGKSLNIPVLFGLEITAAVLVLAIVAAILCHRVDRRPRELGEVRMLPYRGLKYGAMAASIIMPVQLATHLLAMLTPG